MDNSLLLPSSTVFKGSDLIDRIRQSCIDLQYKNVDENEIEQLLIESLTYFEKDISNDILRELFSLIGYCLRHLTKELMSFINLILSKSRTNANYIIVTAKSILYLVCKQNQTDLPDYHSFVEDALNEILPQILDPDQKKLFVFSHEIPAEFKLDLIVSLLIINDLTEKIVIDFGSFILSQNNASFYLNQKKKIQILLKKIDKAGFTNIIYQIIFSNSDLYSVISIDNCHLYLNSFSDEMFIEKFQQIESFYIKAPELNREFILTLLQKCQLYHLKLKSIEKIFNYILPEDLTPNLIDFLTNYDFVLPPDVAKKFIGISDFSFLLKVIPNIDIIPEELHEKFLLNTNNIDFYNRINQSSSTKSHVFNSSEFYVHIYDIISQQKDNKNTTNLIKKISAIIQNCVDDKNFNKIIDEIIFSRYPPNNEFTSFLTSFINCFNRYHLDLFNNPNHMSIIINKILQKNVIPSPSFLCLICGDSIMKIMNDMHLRSLKINHIYYYCYHFSNKTKKYGGFPKILPIKSLKNNDDQNLIDFISNNNFDLFSKLNEDSFILAINALIYSEDEAGRYIQGLTKENILPFCAIAWKNWKRKSSQNNKNINMFQDDIMQNLFIDSFKNSTNSELSLIKCSINSILSTDMKSPIFNSLQMKNNIIENLINSLLKNEYSADKTVLFAYLFCNSNSFRYIKIDSKGLFQYFIQHLHEIDNESIKYKINFNFLDASYSINKLFIDIIENKNSSKSDVINCVNFIMNFCYNIKSLKINNIDNLVEIIKNEEDNQNAALISKFNRYFRISQLNSNVSIPIQLTNNENNLIPDMKNEINNIILSILSDNYIERNDLLINNLFKQMIKNKSLYKEYIQILIHNLDSYTEVNPINILSLYANEYYDDNETFIQSLNLVRILHPKKLVFIKRAKTNECKYIASDVEKSIIETIFCSIKQKQGNYQAFFCLNSIALTFPFLLESHAEKIFNMVLPELDNFSLIFENNENEDREMKVKTSIAAFSFLISALHSNKLIDSFFVWFFKNISIFSESAIYCFNYILYSALKIEKIKIIVMSFLLEYNYIDIIQILMNKEIQNIAFKENHMKIIYLLLNQYYQSINNFKQIDCAIVDHLINSKDRFYSFFDHQTTFLPCKINQITKDIFINMPDCQMNKKITSFIDDFNRPRTFWINYKRNTKKNQMIDQNKTDDFISKYSSITKYVNKKNFTYEKKEIIPSTITFEMINYLLDNEKWIFKWIYENCTFPILNEHYNALIKSVDDLKAIEQMNTKKINELNVDNYFKMQHDQFDLFKSLISRINSSSNDIFLILCQTLETISERRDIMKSIITLIDKNINEIIEKEEKGENTYNLLNKNLSFLVKISKNNDFQQYFLDICCSKIINLCLNPQYRIRYFILNKLTNILLNITDKKLPIQATHIISFILITAYDKDLLLALKLYSKFTFEEVDHITIIQVLFKNELEKQKVSTNNIYNFLRFIPSLLKSYHLELISLLEKSLENISIDETDNSLKQFIIFLLNSVIPKRDHKISINFNDATNSIPHELKEFDKEFWLFFEKYRSTLDKIIRKQIDELLKTKNDNKKQHYNINKFLLFKEYPELFPFTLRKKLFDYFTKREINANRNLVLNIDHEHLIESSFNELNHIPSNKWKNSIFINYINDKGRDYGGLRRDWFTRITEELLNPNYGLFSASECMKYQPNCKSYKIPDHLNLFKFTGKIIARALLQRENVNARFTHAFLCQILQIPITLKDIKDSDEIKFNSLNYILNNDIIDDYYFEENKDYNGICKTIELKENGSNIKVTNQNKHEYVDLLVDFYSRISISDQIEKFCEGFYSIIPLELIQIFTPTELDLLICGNTEIDVEDMKANTEIVLPYTKNTFCVKLFFETIKKWNQKDLQKLLLFFTGSPNPPINGFNYYKKIGKPVCLQPGGGPERFPNVHTCFYIIDLPQYRTEEELNQKFREAMQEVTFQME